MVILAAVILVYGGIRYGQNHWLWAKISLVDESAHYSFAQETNLKALKALLDSQQLFLYPPVIRAAKQPPTAPVKAVRLILTDTPQQYNQFAWNESDGTLYMAINLGSTVNGENLEIRLFLDQRLRQSLNAPAISQMASQQLLRHLFDLRYGGGGAEQFERSRQPTTASQNPVLTIE